LLLTSLSKLATESITSGGIGELVAGRFCAGSDVAAYAGVCVCFAVDAFFAVGFFFAIVVSYCKRAGLSMRGLGFGVWGLGERDCDVS